MDYCQPEILKNRDLLFYNNNMTNSMTNKNDTLSTTESSICIIFVISFFASLFYLACCYNPTLVEFYDEEDELESNDSFISHLENSYQTFSQPRLYRNCIKPHHRNNEDDAPPRYTPPGYIPPP